jgi:hypothetical protein
MSKQMKNLHLEQTILTGPIDFNITAYLKLIPHSLPLGKYMELQRQKLDMLQKRSNKEVCWMDAD